MTKAGLRTKEKMSQKIKVGWVGKSGRNKVKMRMVENKSWMRSVGGRMTRPHEKVGRPKNKNKIR